MSVGSILASLPLVIERDGRLYFSPVTGLEFDRRGFGFLVAGLLVLALLPDLALLLGFSLRTVTKGLMMGMAALGLNLILRHTQLVSFGHALFFGTGAYAVAVLAFYLDVTSGMLLLLGALLAGTVVAVVVGFMVAGHREIYFALLTLAFGQLAYAIVLGSQFFNFDDGLSVRVDGQRPTLGVDAVLGMDLSPAGHRIMVYYLTVALLLVLLLFTWRLANSPFGKTLDAIGQNDLRAEFIGVPVRRYVWTVFVLSGIYGALGGGLFALLELHMRPQPTLHVLVSGEILLMALVGGFGTLLGPVVGGVIVVYILDTARFYTEYFNAVAGILLVAVVIFFPRGLLGSTDQIRSGAGQLRRDPSVLGVWARDVGTRVKGGVRDGVRALKHLLFGVK